VVVKFHRFTWGSKLLVCHAYTQYYSLLASELEWNWPAGHPKACVCVIPKSRVRPHPISLKQDTCNVMFLQNRIWTWVIFTPLYRNTARFWKENFESRRTEQSSQTLSSRSVGVKKICRTKCITATSKKCCHLTRI